MGIEKRTICTRLDEDTVEALNEIAENENRTMSNLLETIIKEYLRTKVNS